jgi:hypothetical protein
MSVLVVGSMSGAPGVTTTALGLSTCWPGQVRPLMLEADPSGGDVAAWYELSATPGLVRLAAAARRAQGDGMAELVGACTSRLPDEAEVVTGPVGAGQARATLRLLSTSDWTLLRRIAAGRLVIVDAGRLGEEAFAAGGLLDVADALLLLARPDVASLAHVAAAREAVVGAVPVARLLAVGPGPYRSADVLDALGLPVEAFDDAGAAELLAGGGPSGAARRRRRLAGTRRLAASVAEVLAEISNATSASAPATETLDGVGEPVAAARGEGSS